MKIDPLDVITSGEPALTLFDDNNVNETEQKVNHILLKQIPSKSYIPAYEIKLLRNLRTDNSICITKAEKRNMIVAMTNLSYESRAQKL